VDLMLGAAATSNAQLVVVGPGRPPDRVPNGVTFMGAQPRTAVAELYRAADVFVLPSRREGLPVALMEAMSCGLPCVASLLPGATDTLIVDGVSGRLVPVGDVDAFSNAIAEMLRDPVRANAMGAAARQIVLDRFASDKIAECWLRSYALSIGPENPGPPAAG
jgi:glycosyltransferase involved in cell wall biosynthesis